MAKNVGLFEDASARLGFELCASSVDQAMTEQELVDTLPSFDGWIIGDDPANKATLTAGVAGNLRAAVRWGIGMDNVDRGAAERLGLSIVNTPNVFGAEVADVAMGYVIALARELFRIDRSVRRGAWPKPTGISLHGKSVLIVGYGDVGRALNLRLRAFGMRVFAADPFANKGHSVEEPQWVEWGERLSEMDFVILCCPLTNQTRGMVNADTIQRMNPKTRLVNVSRGQLIVEEDLIECKRQNTIGAFALDVFDEEPLPLESPLRAFDDVIFGCHNASNTHEAIVRASQVALEKLAEEFERDEGGPMRAYRENGESLT